MNRNSLKQHLVEGLVTYDFKLHLRVHDHTNADGLSRNPSFSNKDLTRARWHGDCDQEVVPGWHAAANLTLFYSVVIEIPIHGSHDEIDRPRANADIQEDLHVLLKIQQGTFPSSILAMERDRIEH